MRLAQPVAHLSRGTRHVPKRHSTQFEMGTATATTYSSLATFRHHCHTSVDRPVGLVASPRLTLKRRAEATPAARQSRGPRREIVDAATLSILPLRIDSSLTRLRAAPTS